MKNANIQIYEVNNGFIVRNVCPQEWTNGVGDPGGTWVFNSIADLTKALPGIIKPTPDKEPTPQVVALK